MLKMKKNMSRRKKTKTLISDRHSSKTIEPNKIRILVVDDHPIVRQGLAQLFSREADLAVCGEAGNAHEAMAAIAELKPDITIVDITLEGTSGIELIKNIKARQEYFPILVLSMHDESLYAERALRAGARGYVMKKEVTEKLIQAIRQVLKGKIYISEKMMAKMLDNMVDGGPDVVSSPIERFTDRELEVFQLIGRGLGTRQIAKKLHVSIKTVEAYRAHIKTKLNLKSGTELVQRAIHWALREDAT